MSKIRILMAKPGFDGHDRGARVISAALRDAGMEVIYTGLYQSPQQIVESAIQEDVHVIGISTMSASAFSLISEIMNLLKKKSAQDVVVVAGGPIPQEEIEALKKIGVAEVFTPRSTIPDIVDYIEKSVAT